MKGTYWVKGKVVYIRIGFPVEVEPDNGQFHSYCPALKGCHSLGESEFLAKENLRDAIKAYVQSLLNHGEPLPKGLTVA